MHISAAPETLLKKHTEIKKGINSRTKNRRAMSQQKRGVTNGLRAPKPGMLDPKVQMRWGQQDTALRGKAQAQAIWEEEMQKAADLG